jgi:hypothetical protein
MRGQPPSTRDLRRERLVGNWGGASEHIGRQWEELGLRALLSRVEAGMAWPEDGASVQKIVALAGDDALQTALSRAGLPNPDVIVGLDVGGNGLALQALDFKWNLEFASYGQIRAEATEALMERNVRPLSALLTSSLGADPATLPAVDGLLFTPELPVNRWFLQSEQNKRQEYPIEQGEVVFEDVAPAIFFGTLPGWEMGVLLARADRSEGRLESLEGAEHYYRIGAGLQGAVAQLEVSIFVRKPPVVPAGATFDWLRDRVKPSSSSGFLQLAEKLMSTRSALVARLRAVTRCPYRFADLADALKKRGHPLPDREETLPPREREKWGELLRKVAVDHRELVYRTGLKLVEAGLSDVDALARLETDSRRFADRARLDADKLLDAALSR